MWGRVLSQVKCIGVGATLLVSFLAGERPASAYSQFIGYGYKSCSTCHWNSAGNGPLTDYGRAVGASAVAARPFFVGSATTDDDLAEHSSFTAGLVELPDWFRPQLNYRGLYYLTGIEGSNSRSDWVNMQAGGSVTLKFLKDKLLFNADFSYVPVPSTVPVNQRAGYATQITREHYAAYRYSQYGGVYVGLLDVAFGLRVPDHYAFIRQSAGLGINDQSHGVMVWTGGKSWDGAFHALVGNLQQDSSLRQKGASLFFEHDVGEKGRVGISLLQTSGAFRKRQLAALHAKVGAGEGSAVIAEYLFVRNGPSDGDYTTGDALFVQNWLRLARGWFGGVQLEYYRADRSLDARTYRAGPMLQYFPMQRLEFRFDFQAARSTGTNSVAPDSLSFLGQVHLWL